MKRFFAKAAKPFAIPTTSASTDGGDTDAPNDLTTTAMIDSSSANTITTEPLSTSPEQHNRKNTPIISPISTPTTPQKKVPLNASATSFLPAWLALNRFASPLSSRSDNANGFAQRQLPGHGELLQSPLTKAIHATSGLKPKFLVPPVPSPCPHDHLALVITERGLLIRPHKVVRTKNEQFDTRGDGNEGKLSEESEDQGHAPAERVDNDTRNTDDAIELNDNEGSAKETTCVRLSWGKYVNVEEIPVRGENLVEDGNEVEIDWSESVVVYGIVGIMELFSGSYLLVVSSRTEVGHLFHPSRTVYGVKGVTAIPLTEERARIAVNTFASRNEGALRPSSLLPFHQRRRATDDSMGSPSADSILVSEPESSAAREHIAGQSSNHENLTIISQPRVQFSSSDDVKIMTPQLLSFEDSEGRRPSSSRNSSSSDLSSASTPASEFSITTSPVARAVAGKLSFWSRLSKRTPISPEVSNIDAAAEPSSPAKAVHPVNHSPQKFTGATQDEEESRELSIEQQVLENHMEEKARAPAAVLEDILAKTAPPPESTEEKHSELEEKIVRECIKEFTRGGMYFAYTFDITRTLQQKQEQILRVQEKSEGLNTSEGKGYISREGCRVNPLSEPNATLPLWRRVNKQFWWNEWLSRPLMDAGLHSYVLPLMQGYFQIANFTVPADPVTHDDDALVEYIIISRRSRDRAGLRYQRRGIDDDAHVANFVETETVVQMRRFNADNVFSYVQIRGSIPLFWTQSGAGLKPPPLLATNRTREQNLDVLRKHFLRTIPQYGPHTIINLAEHDGKEGQITQGYREYMQELNMKEVQHHEYDFHVETRGMKYENISHLTKRMERVFEAQGYLWVSNDTLLSQQKGVFRVNCIDCLDRTNVVQSAFARHVLNRQLGAVALLNPDIAGRSDTDIVFNDVWANNGDAISRAYAGTSALKGDYTRTGKRDLSGLLNDGVNSLARMYTSTFSDWFCQAVIDFILGNRTLTVFSEFLLKLQSTDPKDLIRLSKIRAEAITTSASRVLEEGETLYGGWTLFAPEEFNARVGEKFEEKVLLLTAKALYIVSYDYTLEKVKLYTRVPIGDIIGISKGAYILSPLEEASRNPEQNYGFMITWIKSNQVTRVTSYSVRNAIEAVPTTPIPTLAIAESPTDEEPPRNLASPAAPLLTRRATLTMATRRGIQNLSKRGTALSNIISNAATLAPSSDKIYGAFKMLPIDPARIRSASSSSTISQAATTEDAFLGDISGASNCKEAAEIIIENIKKACEDAGAVHPRFIEEEDVVSLSEAQRMTSVYAKMEYGVKRLLWLGG